MKRKSVRILPAAATMLFIVVLAARPGDASRFARDGLFLCAAVVIPSLFPFFAAGSLLIELGVVDWVERLLRPVMLPLFRVGGAGAAALALGLVGGYPSGARTATELYQRKLLGKTETERLLGFCNNCGPAFILGAAGTAIAAGGAAGVALMVIHIVSAVVCGLVFRFYKRGESPTVAPSRRDIRVSGFGAALGVAVKSALGSVLTVCAFVVFFTVLTGMLKALGVIPDSGFLSVLLTGIVEMSGGIAALTGSGLDPRVCFALACFLPAFAGLSVHFQSMSIVGAQGLSVSTGIVGKVMHGTVAAALGYLLANFVI